MSTLVGGIVTIAIVAAVLVYALVRTNSSTASSGLTDPNALNPRSSLLSTGTSAPDFVLKNSNGTSHHLAAQRGHPVLLEFFAVWCPVCQGEAPTMKQLTSTYVPKGVRVWSILANPYGRNYEDSGQTDLRLANNGDLAWFAQKFGVHHPQLIDPKFKVVNEYGVGAYPGLYVVNSKGVISYAAEGHQSYGTLAKALNRALSGTVK